MRSRALPAGWRAPRRRQSRRAPRSYGVFFCADGRLAEARGVVLKLALSMLCENPRRRTGLSTLFPEFVAAALRQFPDVRWVVFAGSEQPWPLDDKRVEVVRDFPSNERLAARLWADHFHVAPAARARGAEALLTVGFVPLRTAGLPVAMHVFTVPPKAGGGLRQAYRRAAVRRGLAQAALVIANSRWTAGQLGEARAPMLVSYEGLQQERFQAEGPRGYSDLAPGYVLWASNFYPYKRVELALAAYARLAPELRARHPLVLAGGDWDGRRALAEETARALRIAADVKFVGWVRDQELPALYRGARLHVLPTREETFGRSVTEAMACGCPCLLQDLPVLREVADEAAEYIDFSDTMAAGAALERLCRDDIRVAELRTRGLRRADAFSFDRLARERVAAIAEAIGKGRIR